MGQMNEHRPPLTKKQEFWSLVAALVMGIACLVIFGFSIKGFIDWMCGK